jgi:hypothetical protein
MNEGDYKKSKNLNAIILMKTIYNPSDVFYDAGSWSEND